MKFYSSNYGGGSYGGSYQVPYNPYMAQQPTQQQAYLPQQQMSQSGLQVPQPPSAPTTGPQVPGMLPTEQSYIENILRLNRGKLATVYMTFEGNKQKVFKGIIEAAGRDHLILSDPQTGMRYLLPMVYLDYITFDEEIEYQYPYGGGGQLSTYSPR